MLSLLFECFGVPCNKKYRCIYTTYIYIYNIYIYIITVLAIHNYILDMKTTQVDKPICLYDAYEHLVYGSREHRQLGQEGPGASLSSAAMPAKTAKTKKAFLDEKAVQ